MNKKIVRIFWTVTGFISAGLGAVGVLLPILPTTPFLLLAMYAFARSSEKMNRWFLETKLYKKHLAGIASGQGMTLKSKMTVILTVTLLMGAGFIMMHKAPVGRMILAAVWLFHLIYIAVFIKTKQPCAAAK